MKIGVFDLETNGLLDTLDRIHCCVIKDRDTGEIERFDPDTIHLLTDRLSEYDVLIGHNCIDFDFPALKKVYGWEYRGKMVDTLIMSRVQKPSRTSPPHCPNKKAPHSLEVWGYRVGRGKPEHYDWTAFSPEMLVRCEEDVEITFLTYLELLVEGKGYGWRECHILNFEVFKYLSLQNKKGWAIDQDHFSRSVERLDRWIDKINRAVEPRLPYVVEVKEQKKDGEYGYVKKPFLKNGNYSHAVSEYYDQHIMYDTLSIGGPFSRINFRKVNLNSIAEVKDFLLSQGWKPREWNYKDGIRTSAKFTHDDDFEGISGSLGRLVARRIRCNQRLSILSGWGKRASCSGGMCILRGGVSGLAETGRLKHHTIVNVPSSEGDAFFGREMRQLFIPRPGWKMVGVDSQGNQMRQLVSRMKHLPPKYHDEEFEHAVLNGSKEDGSDLHSVNMRRAGLANRTLAKNFFYGAILFGAGDAKTGRIIGGTSRQGMELKHEYFGEMPWLKILIDSLTTEWKRNKGWIKGLDGRPIFIKSEHMILCYALQSDEAIQMAKAYCLTHQYAKEHGFELAKSWNMLSWYHDEFQMETLPSRSEELGLLACQAITDAGEYYGMKCPHAGDMEIGDSWYETH